MAIPLEINAKNKLRVSFFEDSLLVSMKDAKSKCGVKINIFDCLELSDTLYNYVDNFNNCDDIKGVLYEKNGDKIEVKSGNKSFIVKIGNCKFQTVNKRDVDVLLSYIDSWNCYAVNYKKDLFSEPVGENVVNSKNKPDNKQVKSNKKTQDVDTKDTKDTINTETETNDKYTDINPKNIDDVLDSL